MAMSTKDLSFKNKQPEQVLATTERIGTDQQFELELGRIQSPEVCYFAS